MGPTVTYQKVGMFTLTFHSSSSQSAFILCTVLQYLKPNNVRPDEVARLKISSAIYCPNQVCFTTVCFLKIIRRQLARNMAPSIHLASGVRHFLSCGKSILIAVFVNYQSK